MKKHITALLAASLTLSAAYSATLNGWLLYSETATDVGYCRLDSSDSKSTLEIVKPWTGSLTPVAGAFAGDKYYMQMMDESAGIMKIGTYSPSAGEFSEMKEYTGLNAFRDMASDGTALYAVDYQAGEDRSWLYTINCVSGSYTTTPLQYNYFCLAYNTATDKLLGVEYNGMLMQIDPSNGEEEELGYLDYYPVEEPQSAYYDPGSKVFYWASYSERGAYFLSIDPADGSLLDEQDLGVNNEVKLIGLGKQGEASPAGLPAGVSHLSATPASDGSLTVAISWTNPDKTAEGTTLESLSAVKISRDGEAVAALAATGIGQPQTYNDTVPSAGKHSYSVVAVNSSGESKPVAAMPCWVGAGVPKAVAGLRASVAGNAVTLNWESVDEGENGGYIDPQSVTYEVCRNPGNTLITEGTAETSLTDNVAGMNVYTYTVTSICNGLRGVPTSSMPVKAGSVIEPPYLCDFSSDEMFRTWSQIDGNLDGLGWEAYPSVKYAYYTANFDEQIDADDYLVSAPIRLKAGRSYRISYDIMSESDYPEKLEILFGTQPTAEGLDRNIATYEYCNATWLSKSEFLPEITSDGNYHLAFHAASDWDAYNIYVSNVNIEEVLEGSIHGSVKDSANQPVEDASVSIGLLSAKTDAEGVYSIQGVPSGTYTVTIGKFGYEDCVQEGVTVNLGDSKEVSAILTPRAVHTLTGMITNHAGTAVADAKITVTGYETRTAATGPDGIFSFAGLYAGEYSLLAHYYALEDAVNAVMLNADTDMGSIMLEDKALAPERPEAVVTDGSVTVTWGKPVDIAVYRHDNGEEGGQIGRGDATAKSVFGTIFREPATLTSMTWFTNQQYDTHPTVNVFVFDLDEEGRPGNNVLFSQENVPNTDGEWTTFEFPEPVSAPNGCLLGLSYEGNLCLGLDKQDGSEKYPFAAETCCFTMDYTAGSWEYIEKHDITRSLMVRGIGYPLGEADMPEMTTKREYYVIRYSQKDDEDWFGPVDALSYVDDEWSGLPMGKYRYGVSSVFESGIESEPSMTAWVEKDMKTDVTFELKTNTPANEAAGSKVSLTPVANKNADPLTVIADENATARFSGVPKGKYNVSISKTGYNDFSAMVDLSEHNEYLIADYCLEEYAVDPFNLKAAENGDGSFTFTWNYTDFITDDFESHADFAINSPGMAGWQYVDNDNSRTEPIEGLAFPGNGDEMAFIVFNPDALGVVDPAAKAHSGEKYLGSLPAKSYQNDDYIISRPLCHDSEFTFSFWAKSYDDAYGLESFRAGYSLGDAAPESFIWLTEEAVEVPTEWTKYSYAVPADAKHVAVNCVSEYQFLFMLDDIAVGILAPDDINVENIRPDVTYTVYIDGVEHSACSQPEVVIKQLSEGMHNLGVKAHFKSCDSNLVQISVNCMSGMGMTTVEADGAKEYYTLTGIRIKKPSAGAICIERCGATARKVIVK